jgi:hypothetical protein
LENMSAVMDQLLEQVRALPELSRAWLVDTLSKDAGGEVEAAFVELAEQWRRETGLHSSVSKMVTHPAYLSIIGLGHPVVPLLLRALQEQPEHWFVALRAITRQSPVPPEDAGNVPRMTAAWLAWGRRHGFLE